MNLGECPVLVHQVVLGPTALAEAGHMGSVWKSKCNVYFLIFFVIFRGIMLPACHFLNRLHTPAWVPLNIDAASMLLINVLQAKRRQFWVLSFFLEFKISWVKILNFFFVYVF